ncbi:MAG: carboxypeptidase regulatory-like domain-containing protein, partial [Candidatus Halalkalibacterium sp. M3_1C_030]
MKFQRSICISLFFLIGFTLPALGQNYSVSGKVVDDTGVPISNAAVFVIPASEEKPAENASMFNITTSAKDRTDSEGRFNIGQIEPGNYRVTAYYTGKKVTSKDVTIVNSDIMLNFKLSMLESMLDELTVEGETEETFGIRRLRSVEGVTINDAKKNEVVLIDDITANLAADNSRQVFSKVPGLNIWQSDAAGVQLGIGGRGLSPNRSSNFNTRQNGYDIAADALGYPESYYTPPTRALKRIEIVRGAASLQYGTQFGGLLNFVFKDGPKNDPLQINTKQSVGSYGLFNSFNSVGGSAGDANYYGFYQYKTSNGWRPNSKLDQHTAYLSFDYEVTPKLTINPEYTKMYYLAQQPGGLTDAEFEQDPSVSKRERNWFRVDWNLFALKANYTFSSLTTLNTRFFGLKAG